MGHGTERHRRSNFYEKTTDQIQEFLRKTGNYVSVYGFDSFLLMGMLIYNVYSNTMYENILGNFSMTDQIMAKNISDLITEIADDTEYIYKSSVSDYDYFYELFEDTGMSETGRNAMITKILRTILYMNEAIDHVFLLRMEKCILL